MSGQDTVTPAEEMRHRIMATFAERPGEQLTAAFLSDELREPFNRVAYGLLVLEGDGELKRVKQAAGRVGRAFRLSSEQ
jgi:hypothetical protein